MFQCSCVDGGHVAVAPAELITAAESNEDSHEVSITPHLH